MGLRMNILIRQYNSQIYPYGKYIDCSIKDIHDLCSRAINLKIDIQFEQFQSRVYWEGQVTELTLLDKGLRFFSSPKYVYIDCPQRIYSNRRISDRTNRKIFTLL